MMTRRAFSSVRTAFLVGVSSTLLGAGCSNTDPAGSGHQGTSSTGSR